MNLGTVIRNYDSYTLYEASNQKCCMMLNFQVISEKFTIYRTRSSS